MAITANANFKINLLKEGLDAQLAKGTLKAMILLDAHVIDDGTQDFISDVSANEMTAGGDYVTGGVTLAGITTAINGTTVELDFTDLALTGIDTATQGGAIEFLIVYVDTGTPATSEIITQDDIGVQTLASGDTLNYTLQAAGIYNIS